VRRAIEFGLAFGLAALMPLWPQKGQPKEPPRAHPPAAAKPAGGGAPRMPPPRTPRNLQDAKKAAPRLNAPNGNVERLLAMPPEQRDRILEKLPPQQQKNLRQRFEQFDKRPPEERARLIEMWKHFESLPPEKQNLLKRQMETFNALPEDRRKALLPALNQLRRMSPEERDEKLSDEGFRSRFSESELQMMSDIAENYPLPQAR